jgi:hypothetical protein
MQNPCAAKLQEDGCIVPRSTGHGELRIVAARAEGEGEVMLQQPGFWLIVAGALLTTLGFFGFAFSQNGKQTPVRNAEGKQRASTPKDPPNLFSADAKKEADIGRGEEMKQEDAKRKIIRKWQALPKETLG